jgi:hypothetical protein
LPGLVAPHGVKARGNVDPELDAASSDEFQGFHAKAAEPHAATSTAGPVRFLLVEAQFHLRAIDS